MESTSTKMKGPIDHFPINPDSLKDEKKNVRLLEPLMVSHYSVEDRPEPEGKFVHTDPSRYLRIINLPRSRNERLYYDLTDGYVPLRDNGPIIFGLRESRLNMLLQHLCREKGKINFQQSELDSRPIPFDFVSYRGVLARMMVLPYETRNDLLISAQKYKGTIYLAKFSSLSQRVSEHDRSEYQNICAYGGLRFEEYMTQPLPQHRSKTIHRKNLNYHNHFSCVISSELGSHSLLYSGELDAIDRNCKYPDFSFKNFVEIKTVAVVNNARSEEYMIKNMLNWWAQCYLGAIPQLFCGYRDANMVVKNIERLDQNKMQIRARNHWNPDVCVRFLDQLLSFIWGVMADVQDENLIYEFHWQPGDDCVQVFVNLDPVGENDHRILFDWFFEKF